MEIGCCTYKMDDCSLVLTRSWDAGADSLLMFHVGGVWRFEVICVVFTRTVSTFWSVWTVFDVVRVICQAILLYILLFNLGGHDGEARNGFGPISFLVNVGSVIQSVINGLLVVN